MKLIPPIPLTLPSFLALSLLLMFGFNLGCTSTSKSKKKDQDRPVAGSFPTNPPPRLTSDLGPKLPPPADHNQPPHQRDPYNDQPISIEDFSKLNEGMTAHSDSSSTNRYAFSAKNLPIKDALALFARSHNLNIVPDTDVEGNITVDFRNLSLEKSMQAILDTFGYFAEIDQGLIRVRKNKTEFFTIDYIRLIRGGNGNSTANIASGTSGGSGGGGGGGAGGGQEGASVTIEQQDSIKFWEELESQLTLMITEQGKLAINTTAGKIMVTDRKENVDRIAHYLESIKKTLHRQVDIEAQIYEVILDDEFQLGIDWQNVTWSIQDYLLSTGGGLTGIPTSRWIVDNPIGGYTPKPPTVSLALTKGDEQVVLRALREQGELQVVSQPRIRTLNNQPALIKVGSDQPFFRQSSIIITGTGPSEVATDTEVQMITLGTILSLTPQISEDGWVTMDISPVITRLVDTVEGPDGTTAPEVDIKQTSSLVRLRSNETVVIGGLIANEKSKTVRKVPYLGDIPLLGKLFQGVFKKERKIELVIFVTPTIVE